MAKHQAISLADTQSANQEEQLPIVSFETEYQEPAIVETEQEAVPIAYHIFKLVKKKRFRLNLDSICDGAMNPKTKKRERIWNLRGAPSIWQSELTDMLKDREYLNRSRVPIIFEDGVCRVPSFEDNTLEFLRHNIHNVGKNRNGSGKYDFYEYDAAEEQKLRLDKQMLSVNTILAVNSMQPEAMKKLAFFLGIRPNDDEMGLPKNADGIKSELLLKAQSDPITVKKYMGSKEVEVSYMVRKGIMDAKIDLGGQSGNAMWANGKGFICKVPVGRKPHEYLTELAMTNSNEGRQFKEQLETLIT